jgi:hypothetical protein
MGEDPTLSPTERGTDPRTQVNTAALNKSRGTTKRGITADGGARSNSVGSQNIITAVTPNVGGVSVKEEGSQQ